MRLLLGNAKAWQQVNDGLRLDLKLSGEFVNADLGCVTHTSLRTFLFPLFLRWMIFRGFSRRRVSLRGGLLGSGLRNGFWSRFRIRFRLRRCVRRCV
jgi:hypothetical protein